MASITKLLASVDDAAGAVAKGIKKVTANANSVTSQIDDAVKNVSVFGDDAVKSTSQAVKNLDEIDDIARVDSSIGETVELTAEEIAKLPKEVRYTLEGRKLSSAEKDEIMRVQAKLTNEFIMNVGKYYEGSVRAIADDFVGAKSRLLKEFDGILSPEQMARIQRADSPEKLTKILFEEEFADYIKLNSKIKNVKSHKVPIEVDQMDYAARLKRADFILAREKAMYVPSTNPRVVEIENILKEQYGCKMVSFRDDVDVAEKTLKAFEIAQKADVSLPENVILSDFMVALGERITPNNTVILASQYAQDKAMCAQMGAIKKLSRQEIESIQLMSLLPNKNQYSTNLPEHVVLHEIMHGTHPHLGAFGRKKIPAAMRDAKDNVSLYSAVANTFETYTELATKKLLTGLTPDETRLLEYLS